MNISEAITIKNSTLKKVEEELGRKLTESEMEIFHMTSRIAMMKGHNLVKYGILK